MDLTIKMQVSCLDDRIRQTDLYAKWWIARAVTGEAKSRLICHGDGTPLSDEEKIKDALDTAHNHIRTMSELVDKKIELLSSLPYSEMSPDELNG